MNNRQIAAYLREQAHKIPSPSEDATAWYQIPGTGLVISCKNTPEAVLAVAAKYERANLNNAAQRYGAEMMDCDCFGTKSRRWVSPSARSTAARFSMEILRSFVEDDEWDNARNYLELFDRDTWPRERKGSDALHPLIHDVLSSVLKFGSAA